MKFPAFALCAMVALTSVNAQAATAPNASYLKPYHNEWKVTVHSKSGTRQVGIWTDLGEFIDVNGRKAFRRTQKFIIDTPKVKGTRITVNVFDATTFQAIGRQFSDSRGDVSIVQFFNSKAVYYDGSEPNRGAVKTTSVTFQEPVYDFNGGIYGLLLLGYPLSEGYSNTFRTFGEGDASVHTVHFRVVGREMVSSGGGNSVLAWKITVPFVDNSETAKGSEMTFWVTNDPPYIIRLVSTVPKLDQVYDYDM